MFEKLKKIFRPLAIFYLLVVYIFASLLWWSYLLVQKNNELYTEKVKSYSIEYLNKGYTEDFFLNSQLKSELDSKKQRQNFMILGEGLVFLILLITGTSKIHGSLQKEISLNRQQRNFLLSITHELKSPLAGIKLSLETIKKRALEREKQELLVNNAMNDVSRLNGLVNNLLMAAKIENESIELANMKVDVSEVANQIVIQLKNTLGSKRTIQSNIKANQFINGDQMAVTSIIANLIENAIKYSFENDLIEVDVNSNNGHVNVVVADQGVGVPNKEQKHIFEKFYRIGSEDTRKTKGTGLGLYIVKQLVQKHNGEIHYLKNNPKGSIFKVQFPLAEKDHSIVKSSSKFKPIISN